MSEIPEDVMKLAVNHSPCHGHPPGCIHTDGQSCADGCEVMFAVARAILAERERCAKIAEDYDSGGYGLYSNMSVSQQVSSDIAALIKERVNPSTS